MSVKALGKREFVLKCFLYILSINFNIFSKKYFMHLGSSLDFSLLIPTGLCTSHMIALSMLHCTCSLTVIFPACEHSIGRSILSLCVIAQVPSSLTGTWTLNKYLWNE